MHLTKNDPTKITIVSLASQKLWGQTILFTLILVTCDVGKVMNIQNKKTRMCFKLNC